MTILFILMNLVAFALIGLDNAYAKQGGFPAFLQKIPVVGGILFGNSVFFYLGLLLAAGMFFFQHKTRHWYFRYGFPALAAAQALGAGWLLAH